MMTEKFAVLDSLSALRQWRHQHSGKIGFVPTMGALHLGHLTLVREARRECTDVIVSIFVNPTQFNDPKDLERYPRPLEEDLRLLREAGVRAVYLPQPDEIYADQFRFELREKVESKKLCGLTRPGHFEGVLTVVMKLLQMVRPTHAFFGEKDYQQLRLITDMIQAFFLDVEIVPVKTVREHDGLAMSSRNLLLSPAHRERAPVLYRVLTHAASAEDARVQLTDAGFRVDYVEELWGRRLAAAFLGDVRLIDNVEI